MVYFDNAATTFPKPAAVASALREALAKYGGNPGRAGHVLSAKSAEAVFKARQKCAAFFKAEVENTVFTLNCTHALNTAIKGIAGAGTHFIISDIEHNASARPVHALSKERGITYSVARTAESDDETLRAFETLVNARTKAIVCAAASNVTGKIMPYKRIAALCKKHGICFILDAAQGAGVLPITFDDGANIICCSGHKGLYGPMGTGLMLTDGKYRLKPLIEGGTGSNSGDLNQPEELPDRFESGTVNTAGIIALGAAADFTANKGIGKIYAHEHALCRLFFGELKKNGKIKLYSDVFDETHAPIVPFNIEGMDSSKAAKLLSDAGFYLRGGLHCSYFAHKKMNTLDIGAVRFAPSVFNGKNEVLALVREINAVALKQQYPRHNQ